MTESHINILVTGAAGFLGFHLSSALSLRATTKVYCVDNLSRGKADHCYEALARRSNVERIDLDLADPRQLARLPNDIDVVYHLAALNGTQNFYEYPFEVIRSCTLPTINLFEKYGPLKRLARFVYAGSSESYAATVTRFGWEVPTDEDVPLSIDDIYNPRWSYAASKMHGEITTIHAARSYELPFSIIRYHNVYGPRMGDKHVIPDFLGRASEGKFELYGYEETRSFLYVEDAVAATIRIGESAVCDGEIINVGSSEEITMLDLAKRIMAVCGFNGEIKMYPSPKGSVTRRCPKLDKLVRLIGFRPRWSLEEGIRATARFYLHNELVVAREVA